MSLEKVTFQQLKKAKEENKEDLEKQIGDLSELETSDKSSLVGAVNELFQDVSNGKSAVASAVTDKGVTTASDAAFATMAANIRAIQTGITPSGSININSNGTHDVTNYASAVVAVPSDAPTDEAFTITQNGTTNVPSGKRYHPITVNVPNQPPSSYRGGTFTIEADAYNDTKVSSLDADILSHRSDTTFFMAVFPKFVPNPPCSGAGIRGNLSHIGGKYGTALYQTSSTTGTQVKSSGVDTKPSETVSNFWVAADGLYVNSTTSYKWRAGTYHYVCAW